MFEAAVITALVASPGEIAAVEKQTDGTDLIVLKGGFSSGDSSYKFELKSDGTGVIFTPTFRLIPKNSITR